MTDVAEVGRLGTVTRIPGQNNPIPKQSAEWVCPECDYFEEADDGENAGDGAGS